MIGNAFKASATIVALQIAFGAATYAVTGRIRDAIMVGLLVAIVADFVVSGVGLFGTVPVKDAAAAAGATASTLFFAALFRNGDPLIFAAVAVVAVLGSLVWTSVEMRKRGRRVEQAYFAAILPLGIGTVLGGAFLLLRRLCRLRRSCAAA